MAAGKKRKCTCGGRQTERNHLSGHTMPIAPKVDNAVHRLSVLGLSPDRRHSVAASSALLSPTKVKQAKRKAGATAAVMEVNAGPSAVDRDPLPQFHVAGSGAALDASLDVSGANMGLDIDIDVDMPDLNQGPAADHGLYDSQTAAEFLRPRSELLKVSGRMGIELQLRKRRIQMQRCIWMRTWIPKQKGQVQKARMTSRKIRAKIMTSTSGYGLPKGDI